LWFIILGRTCPVPKRVRVHTRTRVLQRYYGRTRNRRKNKIEKFARHVRTRPVKRTNSERGRRREFAWRRAVAGARGDVNWLKTRSSRKRVVNSVSRIRRYYNGRLDEGGGAVGGCCPRCDHRGKFRKPSETNFRLSRDTKSVAPGTRGYNDMGVTRRHSYCSGRNDVGVC